MEGGSNQQDFEDAHFEHLLTEHNRREARKRLAMMVMGATITAAITFVLLVYFWPRPSVRSELPFTTLAPVVATLVLTSVVAAALLSYLRDAQARFVR
jgi:type II secretory pathway component PulM